MRKILIDLLLVVLIMTSSSFFVDRSGSGELAIAENLDNPPYTKVFTITAYYSPLPCQDRYATGSYDGDIRLNGNGTNGADGTPVYPGMVAAPKSYAFGTKMNISGIGLVAVHDRGGAIVASNGSDAVYDRLDVWMGFGDIGLKRALSWGKRNVEVTVYGVTDAVDENMTLMNYSKEESIPKDCSAPTATVHNDSVQKDYSLSTVVEEPIVKPASMPEPPVLENLIPFMQSDLRVGSSGNEVRMLQEYLVSLNLFRADVTGFYGEVTAHAVFKFQQINGLVIDEDSQYAGVFGSKTRKKLNEVIASRLFVSKKIVKSVGAMVSASNVLTFGVTDPDVTDLQLFLRDQGFFKGAFLTEYFGPVTLEAVVAFQLANGIISSSDDVSAGVVGPATLEAIRQLSK